MRLFPEPLSTRSLPTKKGLSLEMATFALHYNQTSPYCAALGWFKLCSGLPKVFYDISTVIFPIAYAPKASPSEKF